MKTPRMIANHEKAVVPRQGTAAFSISTQFHQLPNRMAFPAISHGRGEKCSTIDNLLPKAHYFCSSQQKLDTVFKIMYQRTASSVSTYCKIRLAVLYRCQIVQ